LENSGFFLKKKLDFTLVVSYKRRKKSSIMSFDIVYTSYVVIQLF